MLHFRELDMPMGEFWLRSPTHDKPNDMRDAISAAHIYGKPIVQAEAFTELRIAWDEHPAMLKALGDRNFCLGINRLVYHVFTHNPWLDRRPGMTLNGVGLYFQRDQTWWPLSRAWVGYAQRCQALLQQGRPVVDVAVFTGEELPRRAVLPHGLVSSLPGLFGAETVEREARRLANSGEPQRTIPEGVGHSANMADPEDWVDPLRGYAYDSINRDALRRLAQVQGGRIVLPGGANYAVLVIPGARPLSPDGGALSSELTERLAEMIADGATVVFADANAWPAGVESDRVLRGPYCEASFAPVGLERDVWVTNPSGHYAGDLAWTHRRTADAHLYFLSNQRDHSRNLVVSLRVDGQMPELWDPVSGEVREAAQWRIADGRTTLALNLAPYQSVFVVFRKPTREVQRDDGFNWRTPRLGGMLTNAWQVTFDPEFGGPEPTFTWDALVDWSSHPLEAVRHYSGIAVYETGFLWEKTDGKRGRVWLDLGEVANLGSVTLNRVHCGTAWTPPFRVEVTDALQGGENRLRILVANAWHNRLVLEANRPEAERTTWMNAPNRLKDRPLKAAGLLGPVTLQIE
jgi:hypothetical protein